MKNFRQYTLHLSIVASFITTRALAHPGHVHETDTMAAINHAAIGWDQLLIVFCIAAVALYSIIRSR